jgi:hypothetical protein
MNLDELKSAWQIYDQKLQVSQAINEKIIVSMIRESSIDDINVFRVVFLDSYFCRKSFRF